MKDMLLYLLTQLVDNPGDLTVEEKSPETGVIFIIHANPADMGKIIGKSGRIIRAIRDLVKLVATKHGIFADVVIAEDNQGDQ